MTLQQQRSDTGLATALRISVRPAGAAAPVEQLGTEIAEPALSDTQLAALATLERHGAMSPGDLAEHEKVQPPSMTRVIAALVDWAFVDPGAAPDGPAAGDTHRDPAGRNLVQRVRRRKEAWLARRLAELSPQERAILREEAAPILEKLSQS